MSDGGMVFDGPVAVVYEVARKEGCAGGLGRPDTDTEKIVGIHPTFHQFTLGENIYFKKTLYLLYSEHRT